MVQTRFESRPAIMVLSVLAATLLSGCVSDDEMTGKFVPYRIEDRYPLTTRQALAIRQSDPQDMCRNWSKDLADSQQNTIHPNHGCAVRVNMATQIADPADLDHPNAIAPAPAGPRALAVNRLGTGTPQSNRSIFSLF